ncbi:hypothetical protein NL676_009196 [Syzygium grande]|nr:hypothetical protein NL676_009196 [Syzygium grande]
MNGGQLFRPPRRFDGSSHVRRGARRVPRLTGGGGAGPQPLLGGWGAGGFRDCSGALTRGPPGRRDTWRATRGAVAGITAA